MWTGGTCGQFEFPATQETKEAHILLTGYHYCGASSRKVWLVLTTWLERAKMVRTYTRKTERIAISEDAVRQAIADVKNGNQTLRGAASFYGLSKSMLHKRIKKLPNLEDVDTPIPSFPNSSKYSSRQIFSKEQEEMIADYLRDASKMQYGLTLMQVREFAYSYAVRLNLKVTNWENEKRASIDWVQGFMRRHKSKLSLRKPENTSLARNISFNKRNVDSFFTNLKTVCEKHTFTSDRIINIDESGVTTVLQAPRVVAPTGVKQVGQCVSSERGELVTLCGIVKASGNTIPPAYVFPRVHFKNNFLAGAPPGSLGLSTRSGWMTQERFLDVIKHVQKHTTSTKDSPILILLDNHESHISLDLIIYCRDNGIVLLTFPPHTSHRLQPLDIAVFGPFKNYCKSYFNKWLSENPGMSITIKQIAYLTAPAYDEAFSRKNITSGFKKAGIFPFDCLVFTDTDFLSSVPTDQPLQEKAGPFEKESEGTTNDTSVFSQNHAQICTRSSPLQIVEYENNEAEHVQTQDAELVENAQNSERLLQTDLKYSTPNKAKSNTKVIIVTPDQVRPFPKAEQRKKTNKGRKKGKTCILTDTPEKNRIEAEFHEKKIKTDLKCNLRVKRSLVKVEKNDRPKKRRRAEKIIFEDSSETNEDSDAVEYSEGRSSSL